MWKLIIGFLFIAISLFMFLAEYWMLGAFSLLVSVIFFAVFVKYDKRNIHIVASKSGFTSGTWGDGGGSGGVG